MGSSRSGSEITGCLDAINSDSCDIIYITLKVHNIHVYCPHPLASRHVQMLAVTVMEERCQDSNSNVNMQYITMFIQIDGPFGIKTSLQAI